jgi:cytochrome P450
VFGDKPPEDWNYYDAFPRLKRMLALMYETIRLYTPVPIGKSTGKSARTLHVNGETYIIPANSMVIPHCTAVHTHPKIWGSDSLEWKPSRWIKQSAESPNLANKVFLTPRKGSFIPWSEGVRNGPGKKFSQVEFVATMAAVLKDWVVEPKLFGGETLEQGRQRVVRFVEENAGLGLLLQVLHPERTPLVWRRRPLRK